MDGLHEKITEAYLNVELPEITDVHHWDVKWTKSPLNIPPGRIPLPIVDTEFAKMLKEAILADEADLTRARQA